MKIEIKKSIEGGKYKKVILDKELVDALYNYDKANEVATYLICNGLVDMKSDVIQKINDKINSCYVIFFEKYKLDKYDVRAHYLFNESKIVD
jgi:hypothetical protein